ncbi:MAG: protein-L-isoaspartate O-methyltransferase, partial [bacterium]|nr:protein-L-isoaspartate O-methyltransferase [bacterium]
MTEQNFSSMRNAMVESQLRTSDVDDQRVIAVMAHVPREDFLPVERRSMAYVDRPVPLAGGRALNPPLVIGRLLKEAHIEPGDTVLLIGAATGYSAALLAALGA